jgi:hypothetical protein
MSIAAIIFFVSTVAFTGYALLVILEERNTRRLVGGYFRDRLDIRIEKMGHQFDHHVKHVSKYLLQLGWYYGVHSVLRTILAALVSAYTYIEGIFERNRSRTKELRKEFRIQLSKKTHLNHIAEHRVETALTKEQQETLKTRKLEQDH